MSLKINLLTATYSIILFFLLANAAKLFRLLAGFFSVLSPILLGFLFAYLLDGLYVFLKERFLSPFYRHTFLSKLQKPLALLLTYCLLLAAIGCFVYLIIPKLTESLRSLVEHLPSYMNSLQRMTESFHHMLPMDARIDTQLQKWGTSLLEHLGNSFSAGQIYGATKSVAVNLFHILIGIVFSVYFLSEKELLKLQVRKLSRAVFAEKLHYKATCVVQLIDCVFRNFVRGQLLDSLVVFCLTFLCFWIFKIPYPLLNSLLIGVTNIIPVFGPFIGAAPVFLIVWMVSPLKALWCLLLIVGIQQLDANLIAPKIVGNSTGLSGLWSLFAITVGGGLFGFWGILLGIPVFSLIYQLTATAVNQKLEKNSF